MRTKTIDGEAEAHKLLRTLEVLKRGRKADELLKAAAHEAQQWPDREQDRFFKILAAHLYKALTSSPSDKA